MAPAHPHATGVAVYPALFVHHIGLMIKLFDFIWADLGDLIKSRCIFNKAGYTATLVACGWAGAIIEVSGAFKQER